MTSKKIIQTDTAVTNLDTGVIEVTDTVVVDSSTSTTKTSTQDNSEKATKKTKSKKADGDKKSSKKDKSVKSDDSDAKKADGDKKTKSKFSFSVSKKDAQKNDGKKNDKSTEPSEYDKFFPQSFEVQGVKFVRLNIDAADFCNSLVDAVNKASTAKKAIKIVALAIRWTTDDLAPKGKKGSRPSVYQENTGVSAPLAFPNDLDINVIDAILPYRAEMFTSHSVYTEFAGVTDFDFFKKRTKEGWFNNNNSASEFYEVDFTNATNEYAQGGFINLFAADEKAEG